MKKIVAVVLLVLVGVLTACGSSKQPDKETQTVIDSIVKKENDVENTSLEIGQKPYDYKEKDFSFLIYHDKEQNTFIIDSWVPFENESSKLEYYFGYDSDKKLSRTDYKSDFESWKKEGNYELVYQSGKFKEE